MEGEQLSFHELTPDYAGDALRYYDRLAQEGGHGGDVQDFIEEVFEAELGTRNDSEVREIGWLNDRQIELRQRLGKIITYEMQRRWL